jgi:hypothetical protein
MPVLLEECTLCIDSDPSWTTALVVQFLKITDKIFFVRGIRNILRRTGEVNCLFHHFEGGVLFSFVKREVAESEETIKADRWLPGFAFSLFHKSFGG